MPAEGGQARVAEWQTHTPQERAEKSMGVRLSPRAQNQTVSDNYRRPFAVSYGWPLPAGRQASTRGLAQGIIKKWLELYLFAI